MTHHQELYGSVGRATPINTGEKSPADLNLARFSTCGINGDQGAAAVQSVRKEASEHQFLPTIMRGMDGQDQRVARDRLERFPVVHVQRA